MGRPGVRRANPGDHRLCATREEFLIYRCFLSGFSEIPIGFPEAVRVYNLLPTIILLQPVYYIPLDWGEDYENI